jgi:phosphatidylserine synthase
MTLAWYALVGPTPAVNPGVSLLLPGDVANASNQLWAVVALILQAALALLAMTALYVWRTGKEDAGVRITLVRIVLALTTVQLLTFYVKQFSAISSALAQFILLVLLLTYRRWYLDDNSWGGQIHTIPAQSRSAPTRAP